MDWDDLGHDPEVETVHGSTSDLLLSPEEISAEARRLALRVPVGFGSRSAKVPTIRVGEIASPDRPRS